MTIADQIFHTNEVGMVIIPLSKKKIIELHNIAFISDCNSNLISLDQLQESEITYHNKLTRIRLKKEKIVIAYAK